MKARDLIAETTTSLTTNKSRSLLTILGIVIGISSVILMMAIGNGTKASIEASIQSVGSNLIMVSSGGGFGQSGQTAAGSPLTVEDATAIAEDIEGIAAVAPVASAAYAIVGNSNSVNVSVTGATAEYLSVRDTEIAYGGWFSAADEVASEKVVVLGANVSSSLFGEGSNPVGQRVRIGGQPFTVIGVTAASGSAAMGSMDDSVCVPLTSLERYLTGSEDLSMVYVKVDSQASVSACQDRVTALLTLRHEIGADEDADFTVISQEDLAQTASTVTGLLTGLLGAIAGISLLVAGIGIMNMMLTTVTERIKEIGLRMAVGARRRDISAQFLGEAVVLTVTGGILGTLFGAGVAWAISALGLLDTLVSVNSILLAVGVSAVIGVVFGWYPARNAARMDPIEALRHQ